MRRIISLLLLILVLSTLSFTAGNKKTIKKGVNKMEIKAVIKTEKGIINLKLYPDKSPITVANFVNLVQRKYYDGLTFHRVIEDFMAQGGDPNGNGSGGPGYEFEDEFNNGLDFSIPGKLAMANRGPRTNGSQFFITTVNTYWLNDKHTIFGEIETIDDMKVVKSLETGDKIISISVSGNGIDSLLEKEKDRVENWNKILDKNNNGRIKR